MRASLKNPELEVAVVNDITDIQTNAHLLKYDSVHGHLEAKVEIKKDNILIDGRPVRVFAEREPAGIPWGDQGVDIVIEATGIFTDAKKAAAHLQAGAKKVLITAPAKNEDITIVLGVNEEKYNPAQHNIVSNASCTTNCLAPLTKVLHDNFIVKRGLMTTTHAYTNDQRILDIAHKDLRRARAGAQSIIPTTTGAAKAIGLVLPELKGKLNGFSIRVPTPNVSLVDLVAELEKPTTAENINKVMKAAAEGSMQGILGYSEEPLVSRDYNGDPRSSIVDALSTMVMEGTLAKVVAWYDNEWAYSKRIVDLATLMIHKGL